MVNSEAITEPVPLISPVPDVSGSAPPAIALRDVTKRFGGTLALDSVSFEVAARTVTGILGPNGSGKTTSLKTMSGFVAPDEGDVTLLGERVNGRPPQERFELGLVQTFQRVALAEDMTVAENVIIGLDGHRLKRPRRMLQDMFGADHSGLAGVDLGPVFDVLAATGLEPFVDEMVGNLPLGVRRRVELSRALMARPTVLLLDEPASGLDVAESEEFIGVLTNVKQRSPELTMVIVEHDLEVVAGVCEQIIVLDFGKVIASGDIRSVFADEMVRSAFLGNADV